MRHLISLEHATLWNEWSAAVFTAVFVELLLWVYAPRRRGHYEKVSHLPLEDDR